MIWLCIAGALVVASIFCACMAEFHARKSRRYLEEAWRNLEEYERLKGLRN